jgi:hypothetical protein
MSDVAQMKGTLLLFVEDPHGIHLDNPDGQTLT